MLQTCTNDDQLGVILGHEIAHTVLSHGVSIMLLSYTFLNEGIILCYVSFAKNLSINLNFRPNN